MFLSFSALMLQAQQPSAMPSLFIMIGMIVVMYFFMIRPQAKRAKEQKKFTESIAAGEKIVTSSGIHGTIIRFNSDNTMVLEVGKGSFLTLERSSISMELTKANRDKQPTAVATVTEEK